VHSHNWGTFLYSVLAAKLARVPIVHGEHGKNLEELDETNGPKLFAKRLLGSRLNKLVTVSQTIAAEWESYGFPRDKIQWIPNGVDADRFRPRHDTGELRRQFELPQQPFIFGSVGRFDPIKNYGVLISALKKLTDSGMDCRLAF